MKLQIVHITDRGLPNQERVQLSTLQEVNLAHYVALLTRYLTPAGVANGNLSAFWFPSTLVKPGDQIVLYSGSGTRTSKVETNGSSTHLFYWGLPNVVWADPSSCVVLIEGGNWVTSQ